MLFHVIFGLVNMKSFFQGTYAYSISNDLITRQCIIEYALSIITKLKSINGRISKDKLLIRFFVFIKTVFVKELVFIQNNSETLFCADLLIHFSDGLNTILSNIDQTRT